MKKTLIIVNPKAGKGNGEKSLPVIKKFIRENNSDATIVITERPHHATEIVNENQSNYNRIIGVGGDGTLNEIINGIDLDSTEKPVLGVIPIGSGNDFARMLGLKKDIRQNLELIFNHAPVKSIDVGDIKFTEKNVNGSKSHKFLNGLGIGFDAYVAYINQHSKQFSGLISYIFAVIKALINLKDMPVRIKLDNSIILGKKLLIAVGNGKTHGGGFFLNPDAEIDDNKLDLTVIDKLNKLQIMKKLPLALFNKLETAKEVTMYKFKEIEIEIEEPYYVHTDGEIISDKISSLEVKCLKNAINVISNYKTNVNEKT